MRAVDVVVVGAGIMGAATARALARDGRRVLLLEQFRVGHKRGSSHGRSRIFRFSYPEVAYVEMAMETLPLWRELEREADVSLLQTTGGLDLGLGVEANSKALDACGAPYEVVDARTARDRFPGVQVEDGEEVLFQPDAGITNADAAVRANVDLAVAHGAELREETKVQSLEVAGDHVRVRTSTETIMAAAVVVAAGAWARELLVRAGIEIPTRPTRQTIGYFEAPDEVLPLVEWTEHTFYSLPSPGQGIKAGEHVPLETTDPDDEGAPDPDSLRRIQEWLGVRIPTAARDPHLVETCIYTNTPDESFVLERHGPIVVGSPCSGHGFKFSPLIGRKLAALSADLL